MKLFSSKLPIHSVRFFMYYKSYYFCLRSCKSHSQENEKFMSTTGQFSRTDSLPFKGRNLICTLDLIDLVMQIQPFLKGWTLKPDVSHHKQGKMFHFSSLVIKVTCETEIQSLSFFSISGFDHANHTRQKVKSLRRPGVDCHAQIVNRLKKET